MSEIDITSEVEQCKTLFIPPMSKAEAAKEAAAANQGFLDRWLPDVDHDNFNMAIGVVIFGNAIIIGLETDSATHGEEYAPFEHLFCWIFTVECILRFRKHGCMYFCSASSMFDLLLVVTGAASLYILPLLSNHDADEADAEADGDPGDGPFTTAAPKKHGGGMFVSMMRLLRLLRVLRILRIFKLFNELSLILRAFFKALSTVVWIGILVVIMDYVVAIFAVQTVGHNADLWGGEEPMVKEWWGSIGNAMQTLFAIMTLADWVDIAKTLMHVYPAIIVFPVFISYIIIASYTMVSLVTGIISESLVTAQQQDETHRMAELEEEKAVISEKICIFLEGAVGTGKGYVTRDEAKVAFRENPQFLKSLEVLGIGTSPEQLDRMLDRMPEEAEGGIAVDNVAEAMLELNGTAKASAVFELKHQVFQLRQELDARLEAKFEAFAKRIFANGSCRAPAPLSPSTKAPEERGGWLRSCEVFPSNGSRLRPTATPKASSSPRPRTMSPLHSPREIGVNGRFSRLHGDKAGHDNRGQDIV